MAMYFHGRKQIAAFSQSGESERDRLDWKIFEEWRDIDQGTTARCGKPGTCTIERSTGLSEKASYTLKDIVEGSFGVKDVWSMKVKVEEEIGHEINWETSIKATKTFQLQAPTCGRSALTIYQLERIYEITYFRKKWFTGSDDVWARMQTRTFVESTNNHDGLPDVENFDPLCGCPDATDPPKYDGQLSFDFGRISFRAPYRLIGKGFDAQIGNKIFAFDSTDYSALVRGLDHGLTAEIPVDLIPEPLLFLGEVAEQTLTARIKKVHGLDTSASATIAEYIGLVGKIEIDRGMLTKVSTPLKDADIK
jgi:hypothetical protein